MCLMDGSRVANAMIVYLMAAEIFILPSFTTRPISFASSSSLEKAELTARLCVVGVRQELYTLIEDCTFSMQLWYSLLCNLQESALILKPSVSHRIILWNFRAAFLLDSFSSFSYSRTFLFLSAHASLFPFHFLVTVPSRTCNGRSQRHRSHQRILFFRLPEIQ
ncbi:unnamed protein product [Ceratitis capitata]|uniref:(Mediterranean fruit fly) hypothetical protein n=1 Tax=Ceratitis capitata TaxID=7213 RepID=A0A811VKQ5_CERCA|nr:unnamed protein product [Ceratitis capitata]